MQHSPTAGFTLIEIMVVVAIVALLSAFGVPAYQDYIVRTRVAEVIAWTEPLKKQLVDNLSNGTPMWSGVDQVALKANLPKALKTITLSNTDGIIWLAFKGAPIDGKTMLIFPKDSGQMLTGTLTESSIPKGRISWTCRVAAPDLASVGWTVGTLHPKYAPQWCSGAPLE